jgi:hypothetical protein
MIEDPVPDQLAPTAEAAAHPSVDPVKELAAKMFRLKKKILFRDPDLALHHRASVINGKLTEEDFWASRQVSLDGSHLTRD